MGGLWEPFWLHFGALLEPFGTIWLPIGSALGSFGVRLADFRLPLRHLWWLLGLMGVILAHVGILLGDCVMILSILDSF